MSGVTPVPESFSPALQRALGIRMGIGADGEGVAWIEVDQAVHWGSRSAHGAVAAALVDVSSGIAIARALGESWERLVGTIELKVNFLRRVVEGDMTATARVLHLGKRIAVTDVDVTNGETLCAKGLATFMLGPPDVSGASGRT